MRVHCNCELNMEINLMRNILYLVVVLRFTDAQDKIDEPKVKVEGTSEKSICVCVPYYQCQDGNIITDGSGLLDVRKKTKAKKAPAIPVGDQYKTPGCGDNYVCCKIPSVGPTVQPYRHKCGVRQPNGINSRILTTSNKSEAQFGEWPWQAMILQKSDKGMNYLCGAVLIDEKHVLTAAHCVHPSVESNPPVNLMVRFGEWDTRKTNEFFTFQDRDVVSIQIHPEYLNSNLWNDIAVLSLRESISYAPHVDTVCLPKPKEYFMDTQCVVTGWGKDAYDGGSYSNIMKVVDVPVIDHAACQGLLRKTRLGEFFNLHPSFLCAGGQKGKDSCKGDGGGPLSCYRESDGVYVLAGLVSWGIDCGHSEVPGVYVNIVHFLDWITKVTGKPLQSYWPTAV